MRSASSALIRSPIRREAPTEVVELAELRVQARVRTAISRWPTGSATRSRRQAGRCATPPAATRSSASGDLRPRLRAPRRARGVARPPGGARAARDGTRARGRAVACRGGAEGPRRPRSDRACRRPATTRGSLRASSRTGMRMPTSSLPASGRCSRCSTGSPTRATSAPSAAAPRAPVRPASSSRRTARRSSRPAVARSSAGAIEHLPIAVVTNLARYLEEVKGPELWVYGAAGDAEASMWETDLAGGVALVFGAEGKGLRPLVRRSCDVLVSIPLGGRVDSLNVSVAAALLLYEARRQRDAHRAACVMADATLYLFDGYNLLHAGPYHDRRELVDTLASFVATKGRTGSPGVRRGRRRRRARPARGALRSRRRQAARAPRRRAPRAGAGAARLLGCDRARHRRPPGREPLVADVLPRSRAAEAARSGAREGSPTSSTRRPAPASSASGEASKRVLCNKGLCFRTVLARFTST